MRTIVFTYKHCFRNRTVAKKVPEFIYELTQKQYLYLMRIADSKLINDDALLSTLTGIPINTLKKATMIERYELGKMFDFFTIEDGFQNVLIKNFMHDDTLFDGPDDFFANITFLEFVFADSYFMQHSFGNQEAKFKLMATLYRKHAIDSTDEEFEGDTRAKFSEHSINHRAESFKSLNPSYVNGILFNYKCIRKLIEQKYYLLFPQNEDDVDSKEPIEPKAKPKCNGWSITFQKFVGEDLVNEDKYASMNAHRVLGVLNDRIKENMKNG